ncbi:MAG: hypothetical protein BM564_01360 [Bacteroidetes bacterium MedPE-SWsnd-G2]|nr:MAG: hypothetical protein BM564_01360 [Bacteroidetes bacterium MedPE-SWsnd-G2]
MDLKLCLHCQKELKGRRDKIYCDVHCKSAYQYKKSIEETPKFYTKVDAQLKLNRKILKLFNKAGKATVRAEVLKREGFDARFFTHYWKNHKGDTYLFAYEFGFLKRMEHGVEKYVLIKWQDYME